MIIGKSSGVKPTASATAKSNADITPSDVGFFIAIIKKTNITSRKVACIIRKPKLLMPFSNSVSGALSASFWAIFPYSVELPVLTTIAVAVPPRLSPHEEIICPFLTETPVLFTGAGVFYWE
jgi:cellobiose-specific phosphotransferase system component IIC